MDTDIVVVGAGPTGLMLAAWLAELEIDAVIVDGNVNPSVVSALECDLGCEVHVLPRPRARRSCPANSPSYGRTATSPLEPSPLRPLGRLPKCCLVVVRSRVGAVVLQSLFDTVVLREALHAGGQLQRVR